MKNNIIAFTQPTPKRDEEDSTTPLSPLAELIWDTHYFRNEIFSLVLEQIKVVETAAWFRERSDDLNQHRASNLDAISARRAPAIAAAWLESLDSLEQVKAAMLHCLEIAQAGLEKQRAEISAWSADKPFAEFLELSERIQTSIEGAHGPQPVKAAIPANNDSATAELKVNPAQYGEDLEFLRKVRDLCMPAA